jgi:chimaerin
VSQKEPFRSDQILIIFLLVYKIQLEAPAPKPILCAINVPHSPYGTIFHGHMTHKESERILASSPDGSFLVRQSANALDFYTLSLQFDRKVKHYKINYSEYDGHYQNKEDFKKFDTIHELVADGLLTFYMQKHAAPIIQEMLCQTEKSYQQSPYYTLNKRKLRALSKDLKPPLALESGRKEELLFLTVDAEEPLPEVYEKKHKFKINNFKGLNWCEFCANYLWGFKAQGVKCEDCGFVAHNKCSELVPAKCVPDLKRIRGIFGIDITTLVTAHKSTIPWIIRRCVEEVESRGMLQEGIYRVSGFADEIDALKMSLDKDGEKADMSETAYSNINVIAGIMKLYLRLLPLPLITHQAYPAFIGSTSG